MNFSTRFFAIYKFKDKEGNEDFPAIAVNGKSGEIALPTMVESEPDNGFLDGLSKLDPEVKKFFTPSSCTSASFFSLSQTLKEELARTTWEAKVPAWIDDDLKSSLEDRGEEGVFYHLTIKDISAFKFPSGILIVYLTVNPSFPLIDIYVAEACKMLVNSLHRYGSYSGTSKSQTTLIKRIFGDPRQHESVVKRFGNNTGVSFASGLCGQEITLSDLLNSIVGNGFEHLMGDRFLVSSFIHNDWDGNGKPFGTEQYVDLVRLARGENN